MCNWNMHYRLSNSNYASGTNLIQCNEVIVAVALNIIETIQFVTIKFGYGL